MARPLVASGFGCYASPFPVDLLLHVLTSHWPVGTDMDTAVTYQMHLTDWFVTPRPSHCIIAHQSKAGMLCDSLSMWVMGFAGCE